MASLLDIATAERQARQARESLHDFVKAYWHVIDTKPFQDDWYVGAICEHLQALYEGEIENLLINIRPRIGKSQISSVLFPAWTWVNDPTFRILSGSYASTLAGRDARRSRQVIESKQYQNAYGHLFRMSTDQNVKTRYENDQNGSRVSTSVGGSVTGDGGDLLILDDPHNVLDTIRASKNQRREKIETVLRWHSEAWYNRVNDEQNARRLVIAQRVAENDLSGHLIEKGGWEHLCLQNEYDPKTAITVPTSLGFTDPRKKEGDLLAAKISTKKSTKKVRAELGNAVYEAQYQQNPAPLEGVMFNVKDLQTHPGTRTAKDGLTVCSWDFTFKDLDTSDYVVGMVWQYEAPNLYLLDMVRAKLDFKAALATVYSMHEAHPGLDGHLIEDKANGTAIMSMIRSEIPGVLDYNPDDNKEARAQVAVPKMEAGNVYIPKTKPGDKLHAYIEAFKNELRFFPLGKHDDTIDAFSQIVIYFYYGKKKKAQMKFA